VRCAMVSCRNGEQNWTGFEQWMGILQETPSWYAIAAIKRLKRSGGLPEWFDEPIGIARYRVNVPSVDLAVTDAITRDRVDSVEFLD
jgi:hypothetical protein